MKSQLVRCDAVLMWECEFDIYPYMMKNTDEYTV